MQHGIVERVKDILSDIIDQPDWKLWYLHAEKIIRHPDYDEEGKHYSLLNHVLIMPILGHCDLAVLHQLYPTYRLFIILWRLVAPQPLRVLRVLFSPVMSRWVGGMVFSWAGGRKKLVWAIS